jgi:hypothetical protein
MITVRLQGGLGNQMFQYATAKAVALKKGCKLNLSTRLLTLNNPNITKRNFELDMFKLIDNPDVVVDSNQAINRGVFLESGHMYDESVFGVDSGIHLLGYFQNENYFADINSIKSDFEFKNKIPEFASDLAAEISQVNSVCINVRRADYVTHSATNSFHGVMDMDYYNSAINYVKSVVDNPEFFVFSDDIEWCKNKFSYKIIDHNYSGDRFGLYLQLMMKCKHFIIPNSTFAWWAAWLSEIMGETVIVAPEKWFQSAETGIVPGRWKTI